MVIATPQKINNTLCFETEMPLDSGVNIRNSSIPVQQCNSSPGSPKAISLKNNMSPAISSPLSQDSKITPPPLAALQRTDSSSKCHGSSQISLLGLAHHNQSQSSLLSETPSSPIASPYHKQDWNKEPAAADGVTNSTSMSQLFMKPFQYLSCKKAYHGCARNFTKPHQLECGFTKSDGKAKSRENPAALHITVPTENLSPQQMEQFWLQQKRFIEQFMRQGSDEKVPGKRVQGTGPRATLELNEHHAHIAHSSFSSNHTDSGSDASVSEGVGDEQRYNNTSTSQNSDSVTREEFHHLLTLLEKNQEFAQQLKIEHAQMLSELTQKVQSHDTDVAALSSHSDNSAEMHQLELHLEQRMKQQLHRIDEWRQQVEESMQKVQLAHTSPSNPNDEMLQQLNHLAASVDSLSERISLMEQNAESNLTSEQAEQHFTECTNRVHKAEELLLSQTSMMQSQVHNAAQKQESTLESILKRLQVLEKANETKSQQGATTVKPLKTRSRSKSEIMSPSNSRKRTATTSNVNTPVVARRQRSSTITSATACRYQQPRDSAVPKNILSNIRKETLHHGQQLTEMKKEIAQMKKNMSVWRRDNKATKDIISKTKNQYEMLEGKLNVIHAKNKDNLQLKGVGSNGIQYYEF